MRAAIGVRLAGPLELLDQVITEDLADHRFGVRWGQVTGFELAQATVDAHSGR